PSCNLIGCQSRPKLFRGLATRARLASERKPFEVQHLEMRRKTGAMKASAPQSFGTQLRLLREAAGFTQEELATIAGLSVHAVSALERGERRRPHVETVRALSAALDLTGAARDALLRNARAPANRAAAES